MASSQKKRFTFFGSPPMSPILPPTKPLSSYFISQEKHDDKLPNNDDVRKAVDNLERLVLAAEAYRDLVNKLGKASKTLSKTLKDYGNSKGMENVHVMCFQTTSQFYENHTEIQSKLNKALQKDFDSIQKLWDKYSKRVVKDEKTHNDYVGDLDKQIKKMNKDYEKKAKKENKASLESHNQYMTSITNLGSEIVRTQKEYAEKVAKREKRTHSIISQIICKLAEGHFAYFNESLKKCGPTITKMKEWSPFAGEDMPPPQDLDIFLDDQETQSQSDKNSTISDRTPVSIASISEKQIAAMNFSQEPKFQFNEESENIIPVKYVQIPEPKHPLITTPETTKLTHARPSSLIFDGINVLNMKNDEYTTSSSPTSSVPSTPIVQPTPSFPVTSSPNLISRFSIGIRENDDIFLRDEKVVEVHHPEVFIESKVEKNVLNQNFKNQFKNQEKKSDESKNVTNDIKRNNDEKKDDEKKDEKKKDNEKKDDKKKDEKMKDDEKKDDEKKDEKKKDSEEKDEKKKDSEKKDEKKKDEKIKDNEKKDNEKMDSEKKDNEEKNSEISTKLQIEYQPETKDIFTFTKRSTSDNIFHNRNNDSDGSNTTLNDDKKNNEKSIGELKISSTLLNNVVSISEENETKKEVPPSEKSNENNETIKLISETINKPTKDEKKEVTNEKKLYGDDSLNRSVNQISSENPRSILGGFPSKNKEIILPNDSPPRSSLQVTRQIGYSRDDDYRKEYLRKDNELYNNELYNNELYDNEIRINEMNRYANRSNRDMIHQDESLVYSNSSVLGERTRYNDTYHRTQQYINDDYESYDYTPSQNRGSYVIKDRSPQRTSLSYSQMPYSNNIPLPPNRKSSVREMTNRFQSMNEERRSISPSTRNIPMQTTGHVNEMKSRFGERRNNRDEMINPLRINNLHNGYENVDDRYDEPIDYVSDRYIQYEDLHDGMTPVHHCNCHNCRMAVENSIMMNNNRLPSRHNNPAPFNPRTDSNFMRKNYR